MQAHRKHANDMLIVFSALYCQSTEYIGVFLSVEMCNTDIYYVCHMI